MWSTYLSQGLTEYEERILGYVALLRTPTTHRPRVFVQQCPPETPLSPLRFTGDQASTFSAVIMMARSGGAYDEWGEICFGYKLLLSRGTMATYTIPNILLALDLFGGLRTFH